MNDLPPLLTEVEVDLLCLEAHADALLDRPTGGFDRLMAERFDRLAAKFAGVARQIRFGLPRPPGSIGSAMDRAAASDARLRVTGLR